MRRLTFLPALPGVVGRADLMGTETARALVLSHLQEHRIEELRAKVELAGGKRDGLRLSQEWLQAHEKEHRQRLALDFLRVVELVDELVASGVEPRRVAMMAGERMGTTS